MQGDPVRGLRELLEYESWRPAVIAALAPDLPPLAILPAVEAALGAGHPASDALEAVAIRAVELDDPWVLDGVAEELAAHVPSDSLAGFVNLVAAMPSMFREERARALALLAVRYAYERRPGAALLLFELALQDAADGDWFGERAAWLAPYMDEQDDVERLASLVGHDLAPRPRVRTLVALAPRLTRTDVLRQTAEEVEDTRARARLRAAWVATLPDERRGHETERLAAEVRGSDRAIALVALAEQLPEVTRERGVDAVLHELSHLENERSWTLDPWFWEAIQGAMRLAGPIGARDVAEALLRVADGLSEEWRALVVDAVVPLMTAASPDPLSSLEDLPVPGVASPPRHRDDVRSEPGAAPTPMSREIAAILGEVPPDDVGDVVLAALVPGAAGPGKARAPDAPAADYRVPAEEPSAWAADDDFDDALDDDLDADLDDALDTLAEPQWRGPPIAEATVNTGFAAPVTPARGVDRFRPLQPGEWWFWLEVGEPDPFSIETAPVGLLASVPEGCRVTVALYTVSDGVEILDGQDTGELEVLPDGSAVVVRPAARCDDPELERRRLLFRLRIAAALDDVELRCSIFREQLLVQSRRIRAAVTERPEPRAAEPLITSHADYVLMREMAPGALRNVAQHGLSLMVNGDGATHNLHALLPGDGGPITHSTRFEGGELQDMIDQARRALRVAAFDSPDPWRAGRTYQYGGEMDRARLDEDLLEFAVRGRRFYDACINRLVGGHAASLEFEERTLGRIRIQIALKQHGGLLLPAALFYDQPLDTGLPELRLCPAFVGTLGDPDALAALECFDGRCPSHEDVAVVCPSGFWGFRHDLGLPLSIDEFGAGPATVSFDIGYEAHPQLAVAVSTDPRFTLRAAHEQALKALRPDLGWLYADTREEVIDLMRSKRAQLLYFYCHGGLSEANAPFLAVGGADEPGITSDIFRTYRIRWSDPRPLVFINGCHTTALEPDTALDFVSRLVDTAAAAGVIGTEITTFEPLAGAFATECLRRFLDGEEIGAAVRGARIALLASGNPLGLIYVPFVMPSLRLVDRRSD